MIHHCEHDGFDVLTTDPAYLELLADLLADRVDATLIRDMAKPGTRRLVHRVDWRGRRHAVKRARRDETPELVLQRALRSSYARNLITRVHAAAERGEPPFTHAVYLVAERTRPKAAGRPAARETVAILEYLEGPALLDLPEIAERHARGARDALAALHRSGLVSGDPGPGNFIDTPGGVRVIDLTGKAATPLRRAIDRGKYERIFGLPFPPHGPVYWLGAGLDRFRDLRKRTLRRILGRKAPPTVVRYGKPED